MEQLKQKIQKNKMVRSIALIIFILAGFVCIWLYRLNFTVSYAENVRLDVYIGKDYQIEEVKQIAKEVFPDQRLQFQKIETFNDAIAITTDQATEEQVNTLKQKMKEKYTIEEESFLVKTQVPHLRGRDLIKPYLVPTAIITLLIIGYAGVRYMKLGAMATMFWLGIRLVVTQLVYLAIIGIFRLPIGNYTMPIAIAIYLITAMITITGYQNRLERKELEEKQAKKN